MLLTARPVLILGGVALIPLTKGHVAIIDAADAPLVAGHNWHASVSGKMIYAVRKGPRPHQTNIVMHRVISGAPDGIEVDHRDRNGLHNRRKNLRFSSSSENKCNQGKRSDNSSGMKGVSRHKATGKWRAQIKLHGKPRSLGLFHTRESAHAAYCRASVELHKDFGRTN